MRLPAKELARSETTPTVYALVFVLLSGSVSLYVLGKFLFGRETQAAASPLTWLGNAGNPVRSSHSVPQSKGRTTRLVSRVANRRSQRCFSGPPAAMRRTTDRFASL